MYAPISEILQSFPLWLTASQFLKFYKNFFSHWVRQVFKNWLIFFSGLFLTRKKSFCSIITILNPNLYPHPLSYETEMVEYAASPLNYSEWCDWYKNKLLSTLRAPSDSCTVYGQKIWDLVFPDLLEQTTIFATESRS